ncbi:MAG: SDR family oxidoreductase [Anaerolineae bacterium]|nr:SDR family oxidoreductase [Phycisphaerae bacterium]
MSNIAVVTGAGSGVGRAVVIKLGKAGWDVALVGRRVEQLEETIALAVGASGRLIATPCDVADETSVKMMAARVIDELGHPSVLVNSAGLNIPKRSFAELSAEDYRLVINVNLNGAYYCIAEFLPGMRRARAGTIVNVVSDAGLFGNIVSGPAYIAAKFGLTGLTEALNAEERRNGIRATAISPGAIDTPLMEKRPTVPSAEARSRMLQAEDVAECVMLAIQLPQRATIEQLLIRPTDST